MWSLCARIRSSLFRVGKLRGSEESRGILLVHYHADVAPSLPNHHPPTLSPWEAEVSQRLGDFPANRVLSKKEILPNFPPSSAALIVPLPDLGCYHHLPLLPQIQIEKTPEELALAFKSAGATAFEALSSLISYIWIWGDVDLI